MTSTPELLRVAALIHQHLSTRQSLRMLALETGLSPFSLQRGFTRLAGESPARYALRLRLLLAATELLRGNLPVRCIAHRAGFASVEVLIRNFRRKFGQTPAQYRRQRHYPRRDARRLAAFRRVNRIAPCFNFFHLSTRTERSHAAMPMLSVALRTLQAQPALIIRSRVPRTDIASVIGQSLGRIVPHALGAGGILAGQPFARYPEMSLGMITIEVGMPLTAPLEGGGEIEAMMLPAGEAAVAVHGGPYEQLAGSYAALEQWIAEQGRVPAGPPWEVYVSDPAELPDPADWRTEIYWPVR